jgi:hypothetical protein
MTMSMTRRRRDYGAARNDSPLPHSVGGFYTMEKRLIRKEIQSNRYLIRNAVGKTYTLTIQSPGNSLTKTAGITVARKKN